jgi:hypothetical protein
MSVVCRKRVQACCRKAGRVNGRHSAPIEVKLLPCSHCRLCLQPQPHVVLVLHNLTHMVARTEA